MFWLDDDDRLHPISYARYSRLSDRKEPGPEFAGKVARFVQVVVATSNRRVTGITVSGRRRSTIVAGPHHESHNDQ